MMNKKEKSIRIQIPKKVKKIIRILEENEFEAFAVGGCVRDAILEREPEDWDITTSATPDQIKSLFSRTVDTGIAHGTVTVLMDREGFEVTTYRIDGEYNDSRHPDSVEFTRSLKEDLLRRDFTINAMAYNEKDGLVDLFSGREDLENGVIRCVGSAVDRFGEDALRILRALRFSAQLGFSIEEETKEAIRALSKSLQKISAERIQVELIKLLCSPHPEIFKDMYELGITKVIMPEFDQLFEILQETPHHDSNVGEHTLRALQAVRSHKGLRLTMLFHDMGKPYRKTVDEEGVAHFKKHALDSEIIAKKIMKRLKFDNDTIHMVTHLVRFHDYRMPATRKNVRRAMCVIGEEYFPLYLEVRMADTLAQSTYKKEEKINNLLEIQELHKEIVKSNECVSLKSLKITGKDLLDLGMPSGKEIGKSLQMLLAKVIEDPALNQKETLTKIVLEAQKK